jgi:2-haloacid dehalogenase
VGGEEIRVATFDCYGTLVDWEGGLGSFLYARSLELGPDGGEGEFEPGRVLRERWEEIQFELIRGEYRPYKQVLAESLRRLSEERAWPYSDEHGEALVRSMRSWQPFPDTAPALRRAREAGLRLVIVSNTDRDIIEHTLRQLELPFDGVVTAEDCSAYKPDEAPFRRALDEVGEAPERVLHVAFGFKYDIGPASRIGFHTAWVNRHGESQPQGERPDHVWHDLRGLAELASAGAAPS